MDVVVLQTEITSTLMEAFTVKFNHKLTQIKQATSSSTTPDIQQQLYYTREATNLLMVCCEFYNYGIVHCMYMFELIKHLLESLSVVDLEMLVVVLKTSGHQRG